MKGELLDSFDSLPLGEAEWYDLVRASGTNTIFQTHEWVDAWWRTLGSGQRFWFVCLRESGAVRGFAPLMVSEGTRHRELQFAAGTHGDYLDFVLPDGERESLVAVARILYSRRGEWDSFYIRNLPESSATYAMVADAMREARLFCMEESRVRCPKLVLESRATEIQELLEKYSVRRPLTKLRKAGRIEYRRLATRAELARYLPLFFEQHIERWRGSHHPSPFTDERYRVWLTRLAESLRERDWLHFTVLELNGVPVAFHYGFLYQRKLIWYKPSYSPQFASFSPGIVLLRHLIEDARDRGCTELDFTIGDEPFKERFASTTSFNVNLRVYNDFSRYAAACSAKMFRHAAKHVFHLSTRVAGALLPMGGL